MIDIATPEEVRLANFLCYLKSFYIYFCKCHVNFHIYEIFLVVVRSYSTMSFFLHEHKHDFLFLIFITECFVMFLTNECHTDSAIFFTELMSLLYSSSSVAFSVATAYNSGLRTYRLWAMCRWRRRRSRRPTINTYQSQSSFVRTDRNRYTPLGV